MERATYKAINFDLDTKKLKENGLYTDGYRQLGRSLHKYGFDHRQGSGYVSRDKMISADVADVVNNVVRENPWLSDCVKKCDVTVVGKQFDLVPTIKRSGEFSANMQTKPSKKTTSEWQEYMDAPMKEQPKKGAGMSANRNSSNFME